MIADLPPRLVTLDMDGTVYDPWHCCYRHDESYLGSEACRHARKDTLKRARHMMTYKNAGLAILTYRHNGLVQTEEWCRLVGLNPVAVFNPFSPDTKELVGFNRPVGKPEDFKTRVCKALRDAGHDVVAHYDDDAYVVAALRKNGFNAKRIPHLVEVPEALFRKRSGYGPSSVKK